MVANTVYISKSYNAYLILFIEHMTVIE